MEAVAYCDDTIEPISSVQPICHRKHHNRQQKDQIEEDLAATAFWRVSKPAMMAEPKHSGHDETDHQRYDRLCVGTDKLHPGGGMCKPAGFRQIVGEQRHGDAED